jgi:hypothetical protein
LIFFLGIERHCRQFVLGWDAVGGLGPFICRCGGTSAKNKKSKDPTPDHHPLPQIQLAVPFSSVISEQM